MELLLRGCADKIDVNKSVRVIRKRLKHQRRYARTMFAGLLGFGFTCVSLPPAKGQTIELGSLHGTDGFTIGGLAPYDHLGWSVSGAGDVNGDGVDDIIVGVPYADFNAATGSGAAYVVFGKTVPTSASLDLNALNGNNGFRIDGELGADIAGWSVSRAGDVNDDGFDDVLIGCPFCDPHGTDSGKAYVVFGKATFGSPTLLLSTLDGTNGFVMNGASGGARAGYSVSAAGDVNGDGVSDIVIGAPFADFDVENVGGSYIVFGGASLPAVIELSALNGENGIALTGEKELDRTGKSVASAGDINNDGFDDVVVGVPAADPNGSYSGSSYVVFGRAEFDAPTLQLVRLNGSDGFRMNGTATDDYLGISVSGAGDVNGDGFSDMLLGASYASTPSLFAGAAFVVFGQASFTSSVLELNTLNGSNGFRIDGEQEDDYAGKSVSIAGDVNGDGFDDLLIGAYSAPGGNQIGASYVVFGKSAFTSASLALSTLDGSNGIKYIGEDRFDQSGYSVSGAGDVTGDGTADFLIGTPNRNISFGGCHVVFGSSALKVSKMKATLNFAKPDEDSISIKGKLSLPAGFNISGRQVVINVGGTTRSVTLDDKGSAKTVSDSIKFKIKSKKGMIAAQDAPFAISLKKGDFASSLSDEGLINASLSKAPVSVGVSLGFTDSSHHAMKSLFYSAKQGKSGRAK